MLQSVVKRCRSAAVTGRCAHGVRTRVSGFDDTKEAKMQYLRLFIVLIVLGMGYLWYSGQPASTSDTTVPTMEVAPTATIAKPAGTANSKVVTITEAEINEKLTTPADSPAKVGKVTFTANDVAVELIAGPLKGVLHCNLVAENGLVIIKDAKMDGMLGTLITQIVPLMQQAINEQLAGATSIEQIRVLDGALEVTFAAE